MKQTPQFYYVGKLPPAEAIPDLLEQVSLAPLTPQVAPFLVDTIVQFRYADLTRSDYKILMRYGRPQLRILGVNPKPADAHTDHIKWSGRFARTNYQPIDCNFYDNFEAAIVQRRAVELEFLDGDGRQVSKTVILRDLKTHLTEEFVQLASGEWLRLDRIVSVDGLEAGASCRF